MGCFLCAKHISIETTDVVSTLWSLRSTVKLESNNDLNKSKKVELPNDKGKVASLVAEMVKTLPAVQETCVWSLGREKSPREGKGYPLQYSCLENSMDRGAWWAIVIYTYSLEFTIFIILSIQYRNVKYIHTVVQQISGIFSCYKMKSL